MGVEGEVWKPTKLEAQFSAGMPVVVVDSMMPPDSLRAEIRMTPLSELWVAMKAPARKERAGS